MADALRLAVIGVGHLGRHHARILSTMEGVTLSAVVDTLPERAAEIASVSNTRALTAYRDLIGEVDAVVVAVPTELHAEVAVPFLDKGTPVLVEKPMSRSLADADRMLAAARASGAMIAVGHTERHNPAVAVALRLVSAPRFIEVHRLSAFPDRSLDIDVVFDLMIHDLDVILAIVKSEVTSIEAVGVPVLTPKYDIANVRLRFASRSASRFTKRHEGSKSTKQQIIVFVFFVASWPFVSRAAGRVSCTYPTLSILSAISAARTSARLPASPSTSGAELSRTALTKSASSRRSGSSRSTGIAPPWMSGRGSLRTSRQPSTSCDA